MNIGIYLYDNAEVLDFSGPFEVFTTASRVYAREHTSEDQLFKVYLIAVENRPIQARANFMVIPHHSIRDHPILDVLIIPGGVHAGELSNRAAMDWIFSVSQNSRLTTSVCTGAFLLAQAGVLIDHACTSHWEDIPDLRRMFPELKVEEGVPWVDQGRIITSAGISAGIEMSLHMITRLVNKGLAQNTARQMQYIWNSEFKSQEGQ
ncbi:MAG: DJ-1/PfpI family protein [Chloroflexi bacterium]|nr:DJ-1/PfpI family protein [Chloroflexota bacterium]